MVFGASRGGRPIPGSSLRIRMNPSLELDVRLDAGSLSISTLRAPIRARMSAGPITIEDFTAPLDVSVNAGAIRAVGVLTYGESRIKSDAGAVRVELTPDSNVRILADAALGKIVLPGQDANRTPIRRPVAKRDRRGRSDPARRDGDGQHQRHDRGR